MIYEYCYYIINFIFQDSKEVEVISDGFSGTMFFIERTNFKLYCMKVTETGEVSKVANTLRYLSDLTCSRDHCCGYKADGRTYCFGTFTCGSSSPQLTLQVSSYWSHLSLYDEEERLLC